MFKFVIFTCLVAVAVARPGILHHQPEVRTISVHSEIPIVKTKLIHEPSTIAVTEHTIEKVGEHRERIPTGITHHSSTVLHGQANKVTPILAPAIQTRYEPTIRTYEKQYIEKVPVVESYVAPKVVKTIHEPTLIKSYETPTLIKSFEHPTLLKSFEGPTVLKSFEAPTVLKSFEGPTPTLLKSFDGSTLLKTLPERSTLLKTFEGPGLLRSFEAPTLLKSFETPTLLKSYETPTLLKSFEGHGIVEHRESPFIYNEPIETSKVIKTYDEPRDAVIVEAPKFPLEGHAFIDGRSFEHSKLIETRKW